MTRGPEIRRSGRATLLRGELYAREPTGWKTVCSVFSDEGKAAARTVRVHVSRGTEVDALSQTRLPCGVWWTRPYTVPWVGAALEQCNGALRFRFGSAGMSRTLLCDLASGDYQIPSCEHLYVDCVRYTPGYEESIISDLGLDSVEVEAEISDGTSQDFSPMILTAPSSWVLAGGEEEFWGNGIAAPNGAYAFELYPDESGTEDRNSFSIFMPGAVRDFVGGWTPSGPLPLVNDIVWIDCKDNNPNNVSLVFFVR